MTTKFLRFYDFNDMTQKEFAQKFNIPYATVRNWDARDCMPEYVYNLLRYRIRIEKLLSDLEKEFPDDVSLQMLKARSEVLTEL